MAKGELRCIGSAQHLKSKYGKGYVLTVNLLADPTPDDSVMIELTKFVEDSFGHGDGNTSLISSVNKTKKYLILKSVDTSISEVFRKMELNKSRFGIREWGLSMSSLEDAFISAVTTD